jgi:hypothetical protein
LFPEGGREKDESGWVLLIRELHRKVNPGQKINSLCVGPVILTNPPILVVALLGAIEVVVVINCLYLIKRMRSA